MLVTIHLIIVIATLAAVAYSDEQALLWFLGRKDRLEESRVELLHTLVALGLGLIIVTGGLLYVRAPAAFITSPVFIIKMIAVAALILNTYVIGRLSGAATKRRFDSLTKRERMPLFISGGVSILGWGVALLCGYLLS